MKKALFCISFISAIVFSCGKIQDNVVLDYVEPSKMIALSASYYKLVAPEVDDKTLFTANWTETMFRSAAGDYISVTPVSYVLQIDKTENDFSNPITVASTTELGVNVKTRDFNFFLLDSLALEAGEEAEVSLRVVTEYGQNSIKEIPSSNSVSITVVPFQDTDPLQMLYVSRNGDAIRNSLPMFKNNSEMSNNIYTLTAYFPENCSFRILPSDYEQSGLAYCKTSDGIMELASSGLPFTNTSAGYKNLTVNVRNMTYSFEDVPAPEKSWKNIGLIGSFCNWENEPQMSLVSADNPHIWKLDYTFADLSVGEVHSVKFRAENSWTSRWAAIDADAVPFGNMLYLEGNESDPNVVLRAGGEYRVYFNDITALYIIKQK